MRKTSVAPGSEQCLKGTRTGIWQQTLTVCWIQSSKLVPTGKEKEHPGAAHQLSCRREEVLQPIDPVSKSL